MVYLIRLINNGIIDPVLNDITFSYLCDRMRTLVTNVQNSNVIGFLLSNFVYCIYFGCVYLKHYAIDVWQLYVFNGFQYSCIREQIQIYWPKKETIWVQVKLVFFIWTATIQIQGVHISWIITDVASMFGNNSIGHGRLQLTMLGELVRDDPWTRPRKIFWLVSRCSLRYTHWGGACPGEGWFLPGCAPDSFFVSPRFFRCALDSFPDATTCHQKHL